MWWMSAGLRTQRVRHETLTSGRISLTKASGKETRGYDPSQDIVWLRSEIVRWVQGNLMEKWYARCISLFSCRVLIYRPGGQLDDDTLR
jgi:hypothetical protein